MPKSEPNRLAFSKTALAALPKPESGRVYYYDLKTAGLALCVTDAGSKTYYVYRWVNAKPERIRLGRFEDLGVEQARTLCKAIVGDVAKGKDPAAERRAARKGTTLQELWEHWLETHAKAHKRSWKDDQRQYEKYLTAFHARRLDTIKTADVATWHGRMGQERGPVQANRTLALLATLFNAADRVGFTGRNPCDGVKRFKEESRERFLLPAEMKAFFDALAEEPDPWKDFFLLALFTGARRGNVASARWDEIDLDAAIWRIPPDKAKAGKPIMVPLAPPALALLVGRHEARNGSPWVFPSHGKAGHVTDPRKAWQRVVARAGIQDLHVHDLRRSLGSWAAAGGTSLAIIGAALGHRDVKSTQVYSRLQVDVVREAVTKTTQAMLTAANGPPPAPPQ